LPLGVGFVRPTIAKVEPYMRLKPFGVVVVSLGVCAAPLGAGEIKKHKDDETRDLAPTGKGWGENRPNAPPVQGQAPGKGQPGARVKGNGINYHGGPVLLGTTSVYYIWYGDWSGNTANSILTNLAQNIGGSEYFNINTTYYNGSNMHVSNSVAYAGSTTDNYSQGRSLTDASVQAVVSSAIASLALPKDTNAVYFVLTSADVSESSGFCTQYCGWHTHGTIGGSDIKYAFIGNPDRCPSACTN